MRHEHTHSTVERWLQEEIKKANDAGIPICKDIDPVIEFPKAESFYGMCHKRDSKHLNHEFRIRISEYFLAAEEDEIRQTIMHELIHTCKGCMNHGPEFKKWANVINRAYGYEVARIGDYHKFSLRAEADSRRKTAADGVRTKLTSKYRVTCQECGWSTVRKRRSNLTEHPEIYGCGRCKTWGKITVETM